MLAASPLFSGSVVMIGGSMLANAVNYLYHLIMGRVLGPVDYGVLASVFAILYVISVIPVSTSFAIVKFISSTKNKRELWGVYVAIKRFVFALAIPHHRGSVHLYPLSI